MKNILIFCLLAISIAFAQQNAQPKQRLAVLPSVGELEPERLNNLTDKVREIATKTLPMDNFILLRQDAVVEMIGTEELFLACKEGTCIGELAKKANANYGARCDVFKVNDNFALKFELYSVKDEAILETFTEYNIKDFFGMLAVLEKRLTDAFIKMLPRSSRTATSPTIQSGIDSVETVSGSVFEYGERSYVVNLNTDPQGAIPSFNGMPIGSCSKTPCGVELSEGDVRIVAALEQYETADTTVSIKQNNQNINIKLKSNFGILEIKPAYSDGIGNNKQWSLTINGKVSSSFENRFSPGNYDVKLSHECYEDISFKAGINKGSSEVFEVSKYLNLKQGVLILSSERDGKPVSESVFSNGKRIGETPFNGTVPVCSEISIGESKDKVDLKIAHNQTVRHKHQISGKISTSGTIFTDSRDGKMYKTVKIGTQVWFAENLNYNTSGSKCYNNSSSNCNKYGRLYDWNTAMKACPKGWHLPTSKEWEVLEKPVGGSSTACKHLKAKSGWNSNGNGLDTYGFAALPGGLGRSGGSFSNVGNDGFWWSASEDNSSNAYNRYMYYANDGVYTNDNNKSLLFSVRCLQDD